MCLVLVVVAGSRCRDRGCCYLCLTREVVTVEADKWACSALILEDCSDVQGYVLV